uniref:Exocyst complex component Sec3 PIP2-binding N-terminal domain-containing protein n=1 Tax=Periophthalmus magnuspinnatus TaxID=409849 RepID=A0A3B4AFT1_9GOBI
MNNPSALNKELFVPCGEVLLVAVEVQRARITGRLMSLCGVCSVTKNKPQKLYIIKVKRSGDSGFTRRSQWTVEELRQVNGINPHKDSPEFELTFDNTVDHWVTRSAADKCIFVQVLYGACKAHLRSPSGVVVIIPGPDEGQKRHLGQTDEASPMWSLVQRMTVALGRRKSKLNAAENRTEELRQAAQRFAQSARQVSH